MSRAARAEIAVYTCIALIAIVASLFIDRGPAMLLDGLAFGMCVFALWRLNRMEL